jgi:Protein of unknown function (DUF1579)
MTDPMPGAHLLAQSPIEGHERLHALAGDWVGEEMMHDSRWFEAGPAMGYCCNRVALDGFCVVQDYRQERDGKVIFRGHGVFSFDVEDRLTKLFWFDSLGYIGPSPATGGWTEGALTLVRGSLRGAARHVYSFGTPDEYDFRLQFSPDSYGWSDVVTATYRRVAG